MRGTWPGAAPRKNAIGEACVCRGSDLVDLLQCLGTFIWWWKVTETWIMLDNQEVIQNAEYDLADDPGSITLLLLLFDPCLKTWKLDFGLLWWCRCCFWFGLLLWCCVERFDVAGSRFDLLAGLQDVFDILLCFLESCLCLSQMYCSLISIFLCRHCMVMDSWGCLVFFCLICGAQRQRWQHEAR